MWNTNQDPQAVIDLDNGSYVAFMWGSPHEQVVENGHAIQAAEALKQIKFDPDHQFVTKAELIVTAQKEEVAFCNWHNLALMG